ncbi:MAG: ABC transporter permease [bacterium]|nr:ABC transporter permease [bacterium]
MKNNKFLDNLIIILVFIFLFAPIVVLILFSFNTSKMNITFEGFTLEWYKKLFTNPTLLDALKNTLIVAFTSTIVSTIIGTISAYGIKKYDFKGKNIINALIYIPVVIPEIVLGISLLCIYTLAKLELGMLTLILSHICFSIPFVIISVRSVLDSLDDNLENAASDLGASPIKIFFKIILPSIMPGILSGAQLAFTLSLDDVVISYFAAGPGSNTLPLYIYSLIKTGITPDVNALISLILLVVFLILTISAFISVRKLRQEALS